MTKQSPKSKRESAGFLARTTILVVRLIDKRVLSALLILCSFTNFALAAAYPNDPLRTYFLMAGAFLLVIGLIPSYLWIVGDLINRWEKKLGQNLDRMVRHYSLSKDRGPDLFGPKIACSRVEIIVEIEADPNSNVFEYSIKYKLLFLEVLTEPVRFQVLVSPFPVRLGRARSELYWFPQRANLAPEDVLTLGLNPIHTGELKKTVITRFAETVRDQMHVSDRLPAEGQLPCASMTDASEPVTYGWVEKEKDKRENFEMPTREGWLRRGAEDAVFSVRVRDHPRDGPWLVVAPPTRCTELKIEVRYSHGIEVDLIPYVTGWLFGPHRTDILPYSKDGKTILSLEIYCKEGAVFAPVDGFHIVVRPGPAPAPDQVAAAHPIDGAPPQ